MIHLKESFTVRNRQVDIIILVHQYNGVHFNGELKFKGHVTYVNDIRNGLGDSIVTIRDNKEIKEIKGEDIAKRKKKLYHIIHPEMSITKRTFCGTILVDVGNSMDVIKYSRGDHNEDVCVECMDKFEENIVKIRKD